MPGSLNVIAMSGSLRKGPLNTALVQAAQALPPAGMTIELAEDLIRQLLANLAGGTAKIKS